MTTFFEKSRSITFMQLFIVFLYLRQFSVLISLFLENCKSALIAYEQKLVCIFHIYFNSYLFFLTSGLHKL